LAKDRTSPASQYADAQNPNKVLDFRDTAGFGADDGKIRAFDIALGSGKTVTFGADGNSGELLRISADLLIDVFGFIVLEGQLGIMRDVDWGIYPFVTSSNPTAAFAAVGAGLPPTAIHEIVGVVKAYSTCVGAGPFPVVSS